MTGSNNLTIQKNRKFIMPLVFIAAFLLLYAFTGTALHVDSYQYISMHIRRDPLYPLFLAGLRVVFGDDPTIWQTAAGIIQSVANGLGIWYFADRMTAVFDKRRLFYGFTVFFACVPYVTTRFFSLSKINLSGDILTEAFAYPLFLVLFVLFLRMSLKLEVRDAVISFLLCFVMALLRGQMMSVVVVWSLLIVWGVILKYHGDFKRMCGRVVVMLLALVFFFGVKNLCTKAYCHITTGRYETHSNAAGLALAHVLYVSDPADAEYVPDEPIQELISHDIQIADGDLTLRTLFLLMYDKIEEMQASYRYETGSFLERAAYMAAFNDKLMFQVIEETYAANIRLQEFDYANLDLVENDLSVVMIKSLLPEVFFGEVGWLDVYLRHVFYGFVNAVGVTAGTLTWGIFVLYALACAMMIRAFRKKILVPAAAMFLTLLLITGISTSTAFMQNCISRYMFYAFPVFYVSLAALFTELFMKKGDKS